MLRFPNPSNNLLPDKIPLMWPSMPYGPDVHDRVVGSLVGLAVGDALGASVEFRPHEYLVKHPVDDMMAGGTWGLRAGQWTDDTSMALCLASSLITHKDFNPYDQMVRYKWWYKHGYLSSTGQCFDIGNATRTSLEEFYRRQNVMKRKYQLRTDIEVDQLSIEDVQQENFNVYCSQAGVAGNGALMRLAPVPLFFFQAPSRAVELSGESARLTHGDVTAVDACRYYGALIVAAVSGESKEQLLSKHFYDEHDQWFHSQPLDQTIVNIARGSFKKRKGYKDGIRGKGHIVWALEAALWAFWSANSFDDGALNAVNLGDDTDTTAAIYGQLAGAYYGYKNIPQKWKNLLYAHDFIVCVAEWLLVLSYSKSTASVHERVSRNRIRLPDPIQESDHMNSIPSNQRDKADENKSIPKSRNHSAKSKNKRAVSAPRPKSSSKILQRFLGLHETEV